MNKITRKLFITILIFNGYAANLYAASFIAVEENAILQQEGDCHARHAPCSTFKIAISLMGYHEKILINQIEPEFPFQQGYIDIFDSWKHPHNPILWMKNSCIWYSRIITEILGMNLFEKYVINFNYGNMDVSGDKNHDNGLTHSWLSSSLKISPIEQIVFLQKLINNQLSVSIHAHEMTKNILLVEEFADGWKLYGKTGSGLLLNEDKTKKLELQIGWFIGWIEQGDRTIIFAQYLEDDIKHDTYASIRAKEFAKEKLKLIIAC